MQTLSIREMRNQRRKLNQLLTRKKEIIVTRHNTPVARILPIKEIKPKPDHSALRNSLPFQEINSEVLQKIDREERG